MEIVNVRLGNRSYSVIITQCLYDKQLSFLPLQNNDKVVLVTNNNIASLYLHLLRDRLAILGVLVIDEIILPDGERYKSLVTLNKIYTILLERKCGRDVTLIAFGGGVIGDLVGFVASSYQRGVRFIQIPTTLLAQVDAAIGGKTAVNHSLGKNMIGSFYQPSLVVSNVGYLNTLSNRDLSSGLAEVIKYGIAFDIMFFQWIEKNLDRLLALEVGALMYCIRRCCELKSTVVMADECEVNIRSYLNLGHTFGHAIESYLDYSDWLHGEAVAAGIMMAVNTSISLGKFSKNEAKRVKSLLLRAGLPVNGPECMTPEAYLPYIIRDKKTISDRFRLILPVELGKVEIYAGVTDDVITSSIEKVNCI